MGRSSSAVASAPLVSRQLVFRPQAELEIAEASDWYEAQERGLGVEFLRTVEACIASIQRNPLMHPKTYSIYRRAALRRFPYGIFYAVTDEEVVIVSCYHARRDPKRWRDFS
jgi:plasmid stabilization system protein ParE